MALWQTIQPSWEQIKIRWFSHFTMPSRIIAEITDDRYWTCKSNWHLIAKHIPISNCWIFKVVVYLFSVAVMTRAFPDYSAKQKDLILLQNIASYMLLACGVVYVISVRWWKTQYLYFKQNLFVSSVLFFLY